MLFWGVIATGTLLLGEITTLLLAAFSFGITLLVLAWGVGWFYRPRLELRRDLGPWPSAGEIYRYAVVVQNTGRRTVRNILVEERSLPPDLRPVEEPPVIDELEPGESRRVRLALWPRVFRSRTMRRMRRTSVVMMRLWSSRLSWVRALM